MRIQMTYMQNDNILERDNFTGESIDHGSILLNLVIEAYCHLTTVV